MAEPDKRQIGDGSDNYGEAAKQMAKAAKEAGKETAKQAAVKGAEAGANAAAATVQAGVEGGKAVAEIAAGTAAGGPWGAILSAAWAMRHTLFTICINRGGKAADLDEEYGKLHWSEGLDHRKLYDHGFAVFVDGQC